MQPLHKCLTCESRTDQVNDINIGAAFDPKETKNLRRFGADFGQRWSSAI
jgi:hypothetical protein